MLNDYFVFTNENDFEEEDYFEGEEYEDIAENYSENMPCDTYGYCTSSCPNYRKCHIS